MTTKSIEACLSEAVKRGAVSESDGNAALDELRELQRSARHADSQRAYEVTALCERVDYLEDAVKFGGEVRRYARIGLGLPPLDEDDLALKERAERAEQALADESDAHKKTKERAEKANAELSKERGAYEGTRYMLDCERHEHGLTKAMCDRLRNGPVRVPSWEAEAERLNEQLQAALQELDRLRGDRAKVTRQRRELRRLNRDVALLRGGKCSLEQVMGEGGLGIVFESRAEKPSAKSEEKPAEDRVVRVGDVWQHCMGATIAVLKVTIEKDDEPKGKAQ